MFDFTHLSPVLKRIIELAEELNSSRSSVKGFFDAGETPVESIGKSDVKGDPAFENFYNYLKSLDTVTLNQVLTVMYNGRHSLTSVGMSEEEYYAQQEGYAEEVYTKLMKSDVHDYNFENDYLEFKGWNRDGSIISIIEKQPLVEYLNAGMEIYNIQ